VPLYPDATVAEHLRFTAEMKDVPVAGLAAHIDGIVERTGLGDVHGRMVGNLSKGYRQRVGLAQALIGDPEVLILDEPSSGLDPHQIVEIRDMIRGFRGERTVLLSSHILGEVSRICSRVIILDRGRLVAEVNADELPDASTRPRDALEDIFLRLTGEESGGER
jgi:ABC-2 type transport system ATP-binding protein